MSQPGAFIGQPGQPTTSDADGRASRASSKGAWPMGKTCGATTKDYDIVVAMRRGEAAAFEQYIERFHRILLDYARRAGVHATDRDELVSELLDDVAIQLMTRSTPLPQNPRMYLLSALRHKLLNRKRGSARRQRVVSEAARAAYTGRDPAAGDSA